MPIATNSEKIDISSEVKTAELARNFTKILEKGDVVFLYGEIGVGKTTFIKHLINEAIKLNVKKLSLETGAGEFFLPARKLFIKCGFEVCEPFSHYKEDINSVYMSLLIGNKS